MKMPQEQMIGTRSGNERIKEHTVVKLLHDLGEHKAGAVCTIVRVYEDAEKTLDLGYEVEFATEPRRVETVSVWNVTPEPSPEAKQATGRPTDEQVKEWMAKARKYIDRLERQLDFTGAKNWGLLDHQQGMTHDEIWDVMHGVKQPSECNLDSPYSGICALGTKGCDIKHQQPSAAPTADARMLAAELNDVATFLPPDRYSQSKEIIRKAIAWIKERSAPTADVPPQGRDTADVEKFARETAEQCCEGLLDEPAMANIIQQALAQARAPLVEALKRMPELAYDVILKGDSSILVENLPNELQCICDAALTGTGEKKAAPREWTVRECYDGHISSGYLLGPAIKVREVLTGTGDSIK